MPATPRDTVERFLRAAVSEHPEDMAECYAANVVIEMPFAHAALYPARIETGREELRARFGAGRAVRKYERLDNVAIHETADPEVIITEYDLHGRLVATGREFTQSYLMVMTVRDGRIVHTRDYTDPIEGARLLGRVPDLIAASVWISPRGGFRAGPSPPRRTRPKTTSAKWKPKPIVSGAASSSTRRRHTSPFIVRLSKNKL
ncbi:nuclear transport factor 2 family protein [Actinomadura sp. DC4]|uniref:nuclear transport factor 2 family protein n=1 Tax=Actinomadura sp. DC4 TaxID=3055069 RepID=UPI0025B1951A|nr:nuclear transport factor 2 family protein [Actinomadura sp. DC4]MDN3354316.1 nuclear transport factor 2 family protein [Actinomadura sp. DC4]